MSLLDMLNKISEAGDDGLAVPYADYKYLTDNGWVEQVPPKDIKTEHIGPYGRVTVEPTVLRPDVVCLTAKGKRKLAQLRAAASFKCL